MHEAESQRRKGGASVHEVFGILAHILHPASQEHLAATRLEWRVLLCLAQLGRTVAVPLSRYQAMLDASAAATAAIALNQIPPSVETTTLEAFVDGLRRSGQYDSIVIATGRPHAEFAILLDERRCVPVYLVEYQFFVHEEERASNSYGHL